MSAESVKLEVLKFDNDLRLSDRERMWGAEMRRPQSNRASRQPLASWSARGPLRIDSDPGIPGAQVSCSPP